jgi:hypothetical protein
MKLRAGWTSDDLILIDHRHLVAPVEHVIDAMAGYRASKCGAAVHVTSSQQTSANGCVIAICSCEEKPL